MTHLADNRKQALRVGYQATDWSHPVAWDDYERSLSAWDVRAVMRHGECIGAAYFHDGEVHVSILPQWRRRWVTKQVLRQLFAQPGVRTKVMPGHDHVPDILRRLGFVQMANGEFVKEH